MFVEESKTLIQRLQDVNAFLKEQKERLENFDSERRDIESKELWNAAIENNLLKAKALLKKGDADINWENPVVKKISKIILTIYVSSFLQLEWVHSSHSNCVL